METAMNRRFLSESRLRQIVRHARHGLPPAVRPNDKSAVDPRCVGSRVVQAAVALGHGDLFDDLGGGDFSPFPSRGELAGALGRLLPGLDSNRSLGGVAGDIIGANDSGRFDDSWAKVEGTIGREFRVRGAKVRAGELDLELACVN